MEEQLRRYAVAEEPWGEVPGLPDPPEGSRWVVRRDGRWVEDAVSEDAGWMLAVQDIRTRRTGGRSRSR